MARPEDFDGDVDDPAAGEFDPLDDPRRGGAEGPLDVDPARGGGLTDVVRKAMVAGLGAVFMTEEGIRTMVKDMKLPKDVMSYVVGQADKSKSELFRMVSQELRRFFESAALRRELSNLLEDTVIDIHAEIRIKPGGSPDVKVAKAEARRRGKKAK